MPAKMARSALRSWFGMPKVTATVRIALLPCKEAGKPRIFKPVRESSGESRFNMVRRASLRRPLSRSMIVSPNVHALDHAGLLPRQCADPPGIPRHGDVI